MFLCQELSQIRSKLKTLKEGFRDEVLHLETLTCTESRAGGIEMREIETADNGPESGMGADMGEEFGEDSGVRDRDLRVES